MTPRLTIATPRLGEFSFKHSKADSPTPGESFFDYKYLREFEAKIRTARKVVYGIYEEPISAKSPENPPHCHVPLRQVPCSWEQPVCAACFVTMAFQALPLYNSTAIHGHMFSGQVKEESLDELPFPLNLLPQELQLQQQQQLLAHLHLLQQNRQAPCSFDRWWTVKS